MPKLDTQFTGTVSKTLDTIRSLLDDPAKQLPQYARINELPADDYVLPGGDGGAGSVAGFWRWDKGRWGSGGKVGDVVEALTQVSLSLPCSLVLKCQLTGRRR